MSRSTVLLLIVILFVPTLAFAQRNPSDSIAANKRWPQFWLRFTRAVKNRDRVSLRRMMADDFSDHGGGSSADDHAGWVFKEYRRDYQRSVASGTKSLDYGEQPARITRRKEYPQLIFEFGKDRRWRWIGLVGD